MFRKSKECLLRIVLSLNYCSSEQNTTHSLLLGRVVSPLHWLCDFVIAQCTKWLSVYASYYLKIYICCSVLIVFQIMKLMSHPNSLVFCPTATYKLLTYADVLHCCGMTTFVDVRLARLTSHANSLQTLPSEMSNRLGLLCH